MAVNISSPVALRQAAAQKALGMSDGEALKNTRFGPNPEFKGKPWGREKGTNQGFVYEGGGKSSNPVYRGQNRYGTNKTGLLNRGEQRA